MEILDRARLPENWRRGVLLSLAATDPTSEIERVEISVDYSTFAGAYGADWASRLRLVELPKCGLTRPEAGECAARELTSRNDAGTQQVTGQVDLAPVAQRLGASGEGAFVALMAGSASSAGDYGASTLQPSSTWSAGGPSGDFTWAYPMRVPPTPGGPTPELALAYSSASVDGRGEATNNQPSWVGEGFELVQGFVERSYRPCRDDMGGNANNSTKTGDLCWGTDNAVLSLSGRSVELIRDGVSGTWRSKQDDGSRIERFTNTDNADDDNEYWRVTTADGIQYYFGLNRLAGWSSGKPTTQSVWTAPVAGNNSGEPCRQASFANSFCDQAWRWNLDYVVDLHGNTMSLWYTPQANKYGRINNTGGAATYIRGGTLSRIDYGTDNRSGTDTVYTATSPPARVVFGQTDRCLSSCSTKNEDRWPDTPWDQECTGSSCADNFTPTFWSSSRLASVTTRVWNPTANAYRSVDSWTFVHDFPSTGDGTRRGLWLESITHTGHAGVAAIALPEINFDWVQLPNRVDTIGDTKPEMNWHRISTIWTETGGKISVSYSPPQCVPGSVMPSSPHTNTLRCYPVLSEAVGGGTETDYFHKYVVDSVTEADWTGGGTDVVTSYEYLGTPAWRYTEDDGLTKNAYRTWSDYRGYGKVRVRTGAPGQETLTESTYLRGMHGDRSAPSGGTRNIQVTASIGAAVNDEDAWSGIMRERVVYNGVTTAPVSKTVTVPWQSAATATRTIGDSTVHARYTGTGTAYSSTYLDGGRGWLTTKVVNTHDNYGMLTQVNDLGKVSADGATDVPGDEQCEKTTFNRNEGVNLLGLVARIQSFALACGQTPANGTHILDDIRTSFDNQAPGAEPIKGNVTKVEGLKDWSPTGGGTTTWLTTSRMSYDAYGRLTEAWDVRENKTTKDYTPPVGGPVTRVTTTNHLGWTSTEDMDPAWGMPTTKIDVNNRRTDLEYDALGRLRKVWLPNRNKASGHDPNTEYAYLLRNSGGVNAVTTKKLNADGNYVTTYQLYDGLLRSRQTQRPAASGTGTVFTETIYDAAGRPRTVNNEHHDPAVAPGTTLRTILEWETRSQAVTNYDRAGRPTASIQRSAGAEKWRTTISYGGDRVYTTPPAGGTPTTVITDARGNIVEQRQHKGATLAADHITTTYEYDAKGQLTGVADHAENRWSFEYDILGRNVGTVDPDSGTSTYVYNDYGDLTESTDGNGEVLAYEYDDLGRKVGTYDDEISATSKRSTWTYDTAPGAKGHLHTATRWIDEEAYTTRVRGYSALYQSTGEDYIIPSSETGLGGTYSVTRGYKTDGSLQFVRYPDVGSLGQERVDYFYDPVTGLADHVKTTGDEFYVAATGYTTFGEVGLVTYQHGTTGYVERGYVHDDVTRRLKKLITRRQTAPEYVADLQYDYDDAGNITKIADAPAGGSADIQCFTYDSLRRLTEAWTPGVDDCAAAPTLGGLGGPAPYWLSWTLDDVGNRLTETTHAAGGNTTRTYTYPAPGGSQPHTLSSITTVEPGGSSLSEYDYDDAGNTSTRPSPTSGNQTLAWDAEGRLEEVTDGGQSHSFVYDAAGSRLIRRDSTGKTLYLPNMEIRYTTSTATTSATRYYTYVEGVFAMRSTGGGLTWLATDHQGTQSVAISANANQDVTRRRQTPYGGERGASLPTMWPNLKGFVGGDVDPTGLTHIGARQYDVALGRFISLDPVQDLTDPQQWHGYAYSNNNPITYSDPTGLLHTVGEGGGRKDACTGSCAGYVPHYTTQAAKYPNGRPSIVAACGRESCSLARPGGPNPKEPVIHPIDWVENYWGTPYAEVPIPDRDKGLKRWYCHYNREVCDAQEQQIWEGYRQFLLEVTGIADAQRCAEGSWSGCLWTASAFIPVGKLKAVDDVYGLAAGVGRAGKACSFSGDTEVLMADGSTKPIGEVVAGDEVIAYDPETGERGIRTVTDTWVHEDHLVELVVDGGTISTTEDHPYWNETDRQWQRADALHSGDYLLTAADELLGVVGVQSAPITDLAYNLTVAGIHAYYVLAGNASVLVHNCGEIALGKQTVDGDDMALDIFGMERGAQTYKEWVGSGSWHEQLLGFISDGKTRIHVNLDGIDDPVSYAASGKNVDPADVGGRGFTRWEMYQLSQSPEAWSRVTWYRNGRPDENPFGG
ncbi:polymorphic toxin-type HINT domain-containing protein [Solwaraspora sp. WMMA2056]|uniref:polymorphic toxin-type HINT domain-containing protein n=1 Tax=Solwaraspora sp. WMMA2056 TaxID=3015161 RepID=UPI00259B5DB2|nr:polymorphic toxin-type HINT domain-containing protein [Solwaraspora sp. WMMA2056]WJK40205.1 polymorphic toxin-type HINT domain-containing protein [Solwaraspora sp. WMMA2056]